MIEMEQIERIVGSIAERSYLELSFVVADGWCPRKAQQVYKIVDDEGNLPLKRIELIRMLRDVVDDVRETSVCRSQHQEEYP